MGQKDLSEKLLADYNDVFADIINVLVLDGQHKINAEELVPDAVHSQYKADDRLLHEQERDISKYWKKQKIRLALFGIENQTTADRDMPFRVIGYDGAAYRQQLLSKKKNKKKKSRRKKSRKVAPVITLVLYFGTEKRWNQPLSIKELLDVPDFLDPYVNDYRIHVFNIAWLTDAQLSRFESDFGIVANFFVQKRKNREYVPEDSRVIEHVDAVLKLLSVMTGDNRYESILSPGEKEGISMCDVAERLEQRGIQRGIEQGIEQGIERGIKQGFNRGIRIIYHLVSEEKLSAADAAQELQQTEEEFLTEMRAAGYTI